MSQTQDHNRLRREGVEGVISTPRKRWLLGLVLAALASPATTSRAEDDATGSHPLDPALKIAREGLQVINDSVRDYTATIIKRERIGGKLSDYHYLDAKIRHERTEGGLVAVPFSVYLKYLSPKNVKGREAIWVEGRNNNKLIAHEAGLVGLFPVYLKPDGMLAMHNNRYPITKIGFKNLIEELIEKAEEDRNKGDCEVNFYDEAKVDGRPCRMIEVIHPERDPRFDFFRAQIYIDKELNVPIRYAAWTWPLREGAPPVLEEEYTYRGLKLNVGLTDRDFDPDNPAYNFR
jgi:hypothetical protein